MSNERPVHGRGAAASEAPVSMISDDIIRDLLRQSVQGLELEPTMVLADALLETDRPDLGEDLALILANRHPFPRDQRGRPFAHRSDSERPLKVVFRRIHRRFAWSPYDVEERRHGLLELNHIEKNWNDGSNQERADEIARAIDWLEEDFNAVYRGGFSDSTLLERATWLLDGTFGRGAQILAEEIVDAPPLSNIREAKLREAQLFRLVLAFDDLLPFNATDRVWNGLSTDVKRRYVPVIIRKAIVENGGEVHTSKPRASRRRRPR